MATIAEQIIRIEATIHQQELEIVRLRERNYVLARELDEFAILYNRIVRPIADRVDAMWGAVSDIRRVLRNRRLGYYEQGENLWKNRGDDAPTDPHSPFQSAAKSSKPPPWRPSSEKPPESEPEPHQPEFTRRKRKIPQDMKSLYRQLARQYHPDLADDNADRKKRTRIMAMINEAYANQDMGALITLANMADEAEHISEERPSIDILELRRLQQKSAELATEIQDLNIEYLDMMHGDLMQLKVQQALSKDEDILQIMADKLQQEYWDLTEQLHDLRSQLI